MNQKEYILDLSQSQIDRMLSWQRREEVVYPCFNRFLSETSLFEEKLTGNANNVYNSYIFHN